MAGFAEVDPVRRGAAVRLFPLHPALEGVGVVLVVGARGIRLVETEEAAEIEQEMLGRAALVAAGFLPFPDEGSYGCGGGGVGQTHLCHTSNRFTVYVKAKSGMAVFRQWRV